MKCRQLIDSIRNRTTVPSGEEGEVDSGRDEEDFSQALVFPYPDVLAL